MIKRKLETIIKSKMFGGKAIVVLGPRQTGKTTLLKKIADEQKDYLFLNGDDLNVRQELENAGFEKLKQIIGTHSFIFIDEAQRIKNIGLTAKIIVDRIKPEQLLISGSSALELANEINEPLTGRKWEYMLYPVSWEELVEHKDYLTAVQQLEQRLIYGSYPDVINHPGEEKEILNQLTGSYLYKDLFTYKSIKKPNVLEKILRALALQLGNEVSYNEIARLVQIDKNTVQTYIDLLEKAFVIFRLNPLSRNLRSEISTSRKIYFYDNGIRNSLITNFNSLNIRNDKGALWENFLISERRKFNEYNKNWVNSYFWRTKQQQEIDYIEEKNGILYAYEFKWQKTKKVKLPNKFAETYPQHKYKVITQENFTEFIGN